MFPLFRAKGPLILKQISCGQKCALKAQGNKVFEQLVGLGFIGANNGNPLSALRNGCNNSGAGCGRKSRANRGKKSLFNRVKKFFAVLGFGNNRTCSRSTAGYEDAQPNRLHQLRLQRI